MDFNQLLEAFLYFCAVTFTGELRVRKALLAVLMILRVFMGGCLGGGLAQHHHEGIGVKVS